MPKYVIASDSPITARAIAPGHPDQGLPWPGRPIDPGYGIDEGGRPDQGLPGSPEYPSTGLPGWPGFPDRPSHGLPPILPPFPPGIALPIPPTPEHPMVPIVPDEGVDPPTVWPPVRPEFPDLSGKSLVLALLYVSRHEPVWGWVVIDHAEAKEKFDAAVAKIKEWRASRPQPK